MSPVAMSASYRRTYLETDLMACKGNFKSDKQLINAGIIILSLGFADFVEVLCIAKIQQRFSLLLGKDIHNASFTRLRIAQNVSISTA